MLEAFGKGPLVLKENEKGIGFQFPLLGFSYCRKVYILAYPLIYLVVCKMAKKLKAGFKVVYGCGHIFFANTPSIPMPCPKCGYRTCNVYTYDQEAPEGAEFIAPHIIRFDAAISKLGDRWIINIPKALYTQIFPLTKRTVKVTIEG
jgi:hypothetical protein